MKRETKGIMALFLACGLALAIGVIFSMRHAFQSEGVPATTTDFAAIKTALLQFKTDTGAYPTEETGLAALVTTPGMTNWHGPYLYSRALYDPWGHPYRYNLRDGKAHLRSAGSDGEWFTSDDKTN